MYDHIQKNKEEIANRISGSYNQFQKGSENDLEKGEGSKGGKIIGHSAKTGKPIYESSNKKTYIVYHHNYPIGSSTGSFKLTTKKNLVDEKDFKDHLPSGHKYSSHEVEEKEDIQKGGEIDLIKSELESSLNTLEGEQLTKAKRQIAFIKQYGELPDDFEKAEGDRGGKVIGHTKSGKPIYKNASHLEHKHFTSQDHRDAAAIHYEKWKKLGKKAEVDYNAQEKAHYHDDQEEIHKVRATQEEGNDEYHNKKHEESLKDKELLDTILKTPWGQGRIYEITGEGSSKAVKVDVNGETHLMNVGEIDESDFIKAE